MKSLVIERSIVLADRKTSVSFDAFWKSLRKVAHERNEALSYLQRFPVESSQPSRHAPRKRGTQ
jgi:predicted DNA-binding ribbon-helix-helix protein